jgi:multidrug efflux pump
MRIPDLFIQRPVLAGVVALLVLVLGLRAVQSLPVGEFPHTVKGQIEIQTAYYGADPQTVAGFITTPLESAISAAQGIDYVTSSSSPGLSDITVHLRLNYDPGRALAEIQTYVSAATANFPVGVQQPNIRLQASGDAIVSFAMYSETLSAPQVADYAQRFVLPGLQAVQGVQTVRMGPNFHLVMRAWMDPDRLTEFGMTPAQVWTALSNNNVITGVGATLGQSTAATLDITSSLHTPEQFSRLVIKEAGPRAIRLGDVARVAYGSDPDMMWDINNGWPSVHLSVRPAPSANGLALSTALKAQLATIGAELPPSIHIIAVEDQGDFIRASIREVVITLIESMGIVALVVLLFLGSARAVIVPLVTIPLSLIGTLAVLAAIGFSLNLLTLLALVLAIGLVVDDAIIVVENVNRHMALGLTAMSAARRAAAELLQPILAMTVVLIAAYVPLGLKGGLTGALFTEFAFTLAGAVTMSALLALTLSPMMCSRLLRAPARSNTTSTLGERIERASEKGIELLAGLYGRALAMAFRFKPAVLFLGAAILISNGFLWTQAEHELSPREDTGSLEVSGNGPPNATADSLQRYEKQIFGIYTALPEMKHYYHVNEAPSVEGGVDLKDWRERGRSVFQVGEEVQAKLSRIPGLDMAIYVPPYLPGSSGLSIGFVLQTTGDFQQLSAVSDSFLARLRASGLFSYADKDLKIDQPQTTIVLDRDKLSALGLTINDLAASLNAMLGGSYTGFFSADQRSYKVEPLVARRFRLNPDQVLDYPIALINGKSVPLRAVASLRDSVIPKSIEHFQQLNSATLSALPAPGVTQGRALDFLQQLAQQTLPQGYSTDTIGSLRQYVQESGGFVATLLMAVMITYIALAVLFESFLDPLIILVSVPISLAGALLFVWLGIGGVTVNLFTEVGLVTLMGLISKHGILIVEVAKEARRAGADKRAAIERACMLRLRPILMTTAAMVLGVMPLLFVAGAGAASRFAMGLVIAAGLAFGTFFTLFVLPVVYDVVADNAMGITNSYMPTRRRWRRRNDIRC